MYKINVHIFIYFLFAFLFFVIVALDVLNGDLDFQFYSDSATWENEAIYGGHGEDLTMVNRNEFGPVTVLRLLGPRNYWGMFLFNICIFWLSLFFLSRDKDINLRKMALLVMISPITFTSLMSSNKEIFALLCTCLIIYNHKRKRLLLVPLIFLLSYMSRWQYTLFYTIYLLLFSKYNFIKNRLACLVLLLSGATAGLLVFQNTLLGEIFLKYNTEMSDLYEGSGTFLRLLEIQNTYGYIFVFIPKVLLILVAKIKMYDHIFDFSNAYNNVVLFWQTVLHIYVLYKCCVKKVYLLRNTFFYIALIYFVIFGMSPIFNPRYLYPGIIFICYELSLKRSKMENSTRKKQSSLISATDS